MGIKVGSRAFFMNAPPIALEAINLPSLQIAEKLEGKFDYIHLFVKTAEDFIDGFSQLKGHLNPNGSLWVSWPKGRQLFTDLTLTKVIELGYERGFVESKCLSIDSVWSALKFTRPIEGRSYNNSYGKLRNE